MNVRTHTLILIGVIVASVSATSVPFLKNRAAERAPENTSGKNELSASLADLPPPKGATVKKTPTRRWDVLDPVVSAEAVIIQSLDDTFPFYHRNTDRSWPAASLTKILTAIIVEETLSPEKTVLISEQAVKTEGTAGEVRAGEEYAVEDLLKIMLLASSNDAAAAFEEVLGGSEEFVRLINKKAGELGLRETILYDGSGLSDLNTTSAGDLLRLIRYVIEKHPNIITWTRLPSFLVQPTNGTTSRIVMNINPLVNQTDFLGGKTGTSPEARENLAAIISAHDKRLVVILLGSRNRIRDLKILIDWMEQAYLF